jgi:ribosomal protein S12 methylthiotransferase accessory factor YcaO
MFSSSRLRLHSRKKHISCDSEAPTRVRSIQETLSEILPLCKEIGVSRVSDITCMDRLYIPNFSAILPGTEDIIWVYSGKGTTKLDAKASALMEAIERYSSLPSNYHGKLIQGNYLQLSGSYNRVLRPTEIVEPVNEGYNEEENQMDYVSGYDLLTGEEILVPAEIALYRYTPKSPARSAFPCFHTNGLASGNELEEAICHALCEVIERDAVSIADLCASSIPYTILEKIVDSFNKKEKNRYRFEIRASDKFVDDSGIFPDVDISEIVEEYEPLKRLINKFALAQIPLLIKDITQKDIGIPTFVASSIEWISHDYGFFAKGFGTHPDTRIALTRALTELSQTRAVNIQGARDDLKRIQYNANDEIYKRKWQFVPSCSLQGKEKNTIGFSNIKTHLNGDILDDIKHILNSLKKSGLYRAIVVDLTNPDTRIPVVRAIVPGLESFEVTHSIMGQRAKEFFRNTYKS